MSRTEEPQNAAAPGDSGPRPTVILAISDLMLGSRAREALKSLGMDGAAASSAEDLSLRLGSEASLLIVDLGESRWNAVDAIRRAKERGVPVLAFGRHTDVESLDAAGRAGADRVVPRSVFAASLPELIRELVPYRGERP